MTTESCNYWTQKYDKPIGNAYSISIWFNTRCFCDVDRFLIVAIVICCLFCSFRSEFQHVQTKWSTFDSTNAATSVTQQLGMLTPCLKWCYFVSSLMYAEFFVGNKLLDYVTVCWWKIYGERDANYLCFAIVFLPARFALLKQSPEIALPCCLHR